MRRILIALAVVLVSAPALALPSYLVASWFERGDQFCKYDNGTILNVGLRQCPNSI